MLGSTGDGEISVSIRRDIVGVEPTAADRMSRKLEITPIGRAFVRRGEDGVEDD